jgi:predicted lipid carrier protein YhbT
MCYEATFTQNCFPFEEIVKKRFSISADCRADINISITYQVFLAIFSRTLDLVTF